MWRETNVSSSPVILELRAIQQNSGRWFKRKLANGAHWCSSCWGTVRRYWLKWHDRGPSGLVQMAKQSSNSPTSIVGRGQLPLCPFVSFSRDMTYPAECKVLGLMGCGSASRTSLMLHLPHLCFLPSFKKKPVCDKWNISFCSILSYVGFPEVCGCLE